MQAYDSEKAEADAMDFGTLVHSALEALHGLDTVDESEIFDVLTKRLAKNFAYKYGKNPSLALLQQKAAIERRMRRIANLRAAEISEGWRIHKVEEKFHLEARPSLDGFSWLVPLGEKEPVSSEESVRIVGKIDRIDFHPGQGLPTFGLQDFGQGSGRVASEWWLCPTRSFPHSVIRIQWKG